MNIKQIFLNFYRHKFVQKTATLQIGSFAGSLVQAVVVIFLARLLKPELFGIYTLAFSLAAWVVSFVNIGAQDAVTTVMGEAYALKDKDKIKEAMAFFVKMSAIVGFIGLTVSFFVPTIAGWIYDNKTIGIYAAVIVLASLVSTTFYTLSYMTLQVVGRIKAMAVLVFSDYSLRNVIALVFVFLGFNVLGAALGHFFGALIMFFVCAFLWKKIRSKDTMIPHLRRLLRQARGTNIKKYFRFSALIAVDRNIGNLYAILPVVIIGAFVSTIDVSFFKLSFAYVNLALSLLGPISILLNVEFSKIKALSPNELRRKFMQLSLFGIVIASLLTIGAIIVAPWAFRFFYGQEYVESIKYVAGFIIYGIAFGAGITFGPMWRAINKVKISISINLITLGAGIPIGFWLIKNYAVWGGVAMITMWFVVSHLASFFYLVNFLKKSNV